MATEKEVVGFMDLAKVFDRIKKTRCKGGGESNVSMTGSKLLKSVLSLYVNSRTFVRARNSVSE